MQYALSVREQEACVVWLYRKLSEAQVETSYLWAKGC